MCKSERPSGSNVRRGSAGPLARLTSLVQYLLGETPVYYFLLSLDPGVRAVEHDPYETPLLVTSGPLIRRSFGRCENLAAFEGYGSNIAFGTHSERARSKGKRCCSTDGVAQRTACGSSLSVSNSFQITEIPFMYLQDV